MIVEINPATTQLRKVTIEKLNDIWTLKLDEHPTPNASPTAQDDEMRTLRID